MRLGDILAVFFGHNLAAALGLRGSVHLSIRDHNLGHFAHGLVLEDLHQGPEPMRNRHILKYAVGVQLNHILVGQNPEVLSVQDQNGVLAVWVECDAGSFSEVPIQIAVVGTGREFQRDDFKFLGTVQQGPMVWHVYCEAKYKG